VTFALTATCNCGAVQLELTEPPLGASYCHCTRCQRRTGAAASANIAFPPDALRIARGEDRIRCWEPPTGSPKFFCGDCGSALFSRNPQGGVGVRLGVLDDDPGISPGAHQFTAYAAPWEPIGDDGLPRHPEAPPAR
jgi:hypothetical protein